MTYEDWLDDWLEFTEPGDYITYSMGDSFNEIEPHKEYYHADSLKDFAMQFLGVDEESILEWIQENDPEEFENNNHVTESMVFSYLINYLEEKDASESGRIYRVVGTYNDENNQSSDFEWEENYDGDYFDEDSYYWFRDEEDWDD